MGTYPRLDSRMKISGLSITFAPPTRDIVDSPALRLWHARCNAVRPEEHPVSTVKLGPRRSNQCEMRLESMLEPFPVRT
jgi:hypothetical protein